MNKSYSRLAALAAAVFAVSCGGGGGYAGASLFRDAPNPLPGAPSPSPSPSPTPAPAPAPAPAPPPAPPTSDDPQGIYNGTTSNGYAFSTVVLETGEFWGIYSRSSVIYGAVHGHAQTGGGAFFGEGADFYLPTLTRTPGTFEGSVVPGVSIAGTLSTGTTFNGSYDARYEVPASLTNIAGTYTGQVVSPAGLQTFRVTVSSSGAIQGSVTTCAFTGTTRPRASGKAVFDTSVTFASTGCVFNGQTLTGISVASTAGSTQTLVTAALLPDESSGFLALGSR